MLDDGLVNREGQSVRTVTGALEVKQVVYDLGNAQRVPCGFICTIKSTRELAVTFCTPGATMASAAPTRITEGEYEPPSPFTNVFVKIRSSKLSTAALDGAHTRIL